MKLFNQLHNQLFNSKINFFDGFSLLLFSILPISIIIGNASININILLIDILFLIYCLKFKLWSWIKKNVFLYLLVLYIFLVLNSFYSYFILFDNQKNSFWSDDSILRSILFIKYVLLVFAFSILLKDDKILSSVHKSWLVIITIIILDIFFEKFIGRNIIGNVSPDSSRIVSFFKDEMIVGGLVLCFGYTSTMYYINNRDVNKTILPIILIFLLVPLSIFVTGEKSNFIKSILLFFIINYFFKKNKQGINYKILLTSIFFLASCFLIFSDITFNKYQEIYKRFYVQTSTQIRSGEKNSIIANFSNIKYFAHYDAAIKIFKNYPILGVGNKNFRIECSKEKYFNKKIVFSNVRCSTHPHQIHFEILSEQGILGYVIVLSLIVWFSIRNIQICIRNKNIYHLSNTAYLVIFFIPLLPGGGIFSTFNGSLFWIVFSLVNLDYEKKKDCKLF
jgi:O-antigen ligase